MTTLNFDAQVSGWVRETRERMTAVFRESVQRTISEAQANVPVDTGYLRASLRLSLSAMPQIEKDTRIKAGLTEAGAAFAAAGGSTPQRGRGAGFFQPVGDYVLTIASAKLGDTVFAGYTASYSAHVEYGTSFMAPRAYVGRAAARWPAIVTRVSADAQGRAARRP